MPTFTFSGFSSGDPVAVSATQNGTTVSESVPGWGVGGVASFDISVTTADDAVAPAAVWVDASNPVGFNVGETDPSGTPYDPSFHLIRWVWRVSKWNGSDWDLNPLQPWSAPVNMVAEWNDPNTMYGKSAVFCLTEPGDYRFECFAEDEAGEWAVVTSDTVTVADPDVFFAGDNTIAVAYDGDFTDAPAGAVEWTWDGSVGALRSLIQSRNLPVRLLWKRGGVYDFSAQLKVTDNDHLAHVGAWGSSSARPVITSTATGDDRVISPLFEWKTNGQQGTNWATIAGVEFRGDYDSATEKGYGGLPYDWRQMRGATLLVHDCYSAGWNTPFVAASDSNGEGLGYRMLLSDSFATDWSGFGTYPTKNSDGRFAMLGSAMVSNPFALAGDGKHFARNQHGPIRAAEIDDVYLAGSEFFSNTSWTGNYDRIAGAQPCLRLHTDGSAAGTRYIVNRCVLEGGASIGGHVPLGKSEPGNWLFDQILAIGDCRTGGASIYSQAGGTTVRNVLAWIPEVQKCPYDNTNQKGMVAISVAPNGFLENNDLAPVEIYSCTLLNEATGGNADTAASVDPSYVTATEENNLFHMPNASGTPYTGDGPFESLGALPGVTPHSEGYGINYRAILFDSPGGVDVNPGDTVVIPYADVPKINIAGDGPGGFHTRAELLAIESAGQQHVVSVSNGAGQFGQHYRSIDGEISLSYEADGIHLTFNGKAAWQGGGTPNYWSHGGGRTWYLDLDRRAYLAADLPFQGGAFAPPEDVPQPYPGATSPKRDVLPGSRHAGHDFFGTTRPGRREPFTGTQVPGTATRGAIEAP